MVSRRKYSYFSYVYIKTVFCFCPCRILDKGDTTSRGANGSLSTKRSAETPKTVDTGMELDAAEAEEVDGIEKQKELEFIRKVESQASKKNRSIANRFSMRLPIQRRIPTPIRKLTRS